MISHFYDQVLAWLSADVVQRNITNLALITAWADAITVVIATYSKTIMSIRLTLMINNIFGMLSGITNGTLPTLVKHLINFPLNFIRHREMRRLIENVNKSTEKDIDFEWLRPFMHPRLIKKGSAVFNCDDAADEAYILVNGDVRIVERNVHLKPGEIFGELALFTGAGRRSATAMCDSDVSLLCISYKDLEQLYFQNPEFGFHLIKLIVRRSEATRLALMNGY